jgi:hypothetical protein
VAKETLTDLLSDSDGVELHVVLRRSNLASYLTSACLTVCQSGWNLWRGEPVVRGESSAGRLFFSRRTRSGARDCLPDRYFLCRHVRGMDASTENGSQHQMADSDNCRLLKSIIAKFFDERKPHSHTG